jgi:hypothetical protein
LEEVGVVAAEGVDLLPQYRLPRIATKEQQRRHKHLYGLLTPLYAAFTARDQGRRWSWERWYRYHWRTVGGFGLLTFWRVLFQRTCYLRWEDPCLAMPQYENAEKTFPVTFPDLECIE